LQRLLQQHVDGKLVGGAKKIIVIVYDVQV